MGAVQVCGACGQQQGSGTYGPGPQRSIPVVPGRSILGVQILICDPRDCSPPGPSIHGFPRQDTRVGSHSFLHGIFLTRGSNLGLLHCQQILYHPSRQGSPMLIQGSKK